MIEPQVHFRESGLEHKEDLSTPSHACARSGVTSFLEMPNTRPLTTTQAALDDKLQRAANKSLVNYGFFIGATAANLPDLIAANPFCGIKILHLSTGIEAEFLRQDQPSWVTAEVTPQHLLLNTNAYQEIGRYISANESSFAIA